MDGEDGADAGQRRGEDEVGGVEQVDPPDHHLDGDRKAQAMPEAGEPVVRQREGPQQASGFRLQVAGRKSQVVGRKVQVAGGGEEGVAVGAGQAEQRTDQFAGVPADARPLPHRCRVVDPDPHQSTSEKVQYRLTKKFQNRTTPVATALARL